MTEAVQNLQNWHIRNDPNRGRLADDGRYKKSVAPAEALQRRRGAICWLLRKAPAHLRQGGRLISVRFAPAESDAARRASCEILC